MYKNNRVQLKKPEQLQRKSKHLKVLEPTLAMLFLLIYQLATLR